MSKHTEVPDTGAAPKTASGAISWLEAVSYTAVLGLIALTAGGFFDAMVPWK